MRALADGGSAVPLPRLGWYEDDLQYFGVPFFSMDHVEGLVPSDNIPYTMDGWVIEATPEQQERIMWWSGIDALAAVHRTDWRALGLDPAEHPHPGASRGSSSSCPTTGLPRLGHQGRAGPRDRVDLAMAGGHKPAEDGDVVISWGDSRIGNIIWDDFRAAAVVDWEMASLAQPELDLGWWLYFDRQFSEGLGVPRPAGFGSHEDTIAAATPN